MADFKKGDRFVIGGTTWRVDNTYQRTPSGRMGVHLDDVHNPGKHGTGFFADVLARMLEDGSARRVVAPAPEPFPGLDHVTDSDNRLAAAAEIVARCDRGDIGYSAAFDAIRRIVSAP